MRVSNLNILMVDDDEDDAFLIKEALREIDPAYTLKIFSNWEEVIPFLCKADKLPDLLLIDYVMPGKFGNELSLQIRSFPSLKNIPIVLTTGIKSSEHFKNFTGVDDMEVLTKPANYHELVDELRAVLLRNVPVTRIN